MTKIEINKLGIIKTSTIPDTIEEIVSYWKICGLSFIRFSPKKLTLISDEITIRYIEE